MAKKKIIIDLRSKYSAHLSDEENLIIEADDVRVNESGALLVIKINAANMAEIVAGVAHGNWIGFTVENLP